MHFVLRIARRPPIVCNDADIFRRYIIDAEDRLLRGPAPVD
jgi:hypothetical protein